MGRLQRRAQHRMRRRRRRVGRAADSSTRASHVHSRRAARAHTSGDAVDAVGASEVRGAVSPSPWWSAAWEEGVHQCAVLGRGTSALRVLHVDFLDSNGTSEVCGGRAAFASAEREALARRRYISPLPTRPLPRHCETAMKRSRAAQVGPEHCVRACVRAAARLRLRRLLRVHLPCRTHPPSAPNQVRAGIP